MHRHEPICRPLVGRRRRQARSLGPPAAHPEAPPPPPADPSPPAASPSAPDGGSGTWQRRACSFPSGFDASPPPQGTARGQGRGSWLDSGMVPPLFAFFSCILSRAGSPSGTGEGGRKARGARPGSEDTEGRAHPTGDAHVHKEDSAATGQGRDPGVTAAASVMSARGCAKASERELGCLPQGVPSCQPGPAPPATAASPKPGLITPPIPACSASLIIPIWLSGWAPSKNHPAGGGEGMVCCQREGQGCHPTPDFLCQRLSVPPQDPAVAGPTP